MGDEMNDSTERLWILDPIAPSRNERRPMATRYQDLAGLRLGVLNNSKHNGDLLLGGVADWLLENKGVTLAAALMKPAASSPATPEMLRQLVAAGVQIAITGPGD